VKLLILLCCLVFPISRLRAGTILLSTSQSSNPLASLGGITFTSGDIIQWDSSTDTASMFFRASDYNLIGIGDGGIDGIALLANGHLLLSTAQGSGQTVTFAGVTFRSTDIIEWNPVTQTASMYFDGTANGLQSAGDRGVDAFAVLPNGHLLLSTSQAANQLASLGGLNFMSSDVVEWDPSTHSASMIFRASDYNLTGIGDGGIDGIALLPNGHLLLSTAQGGGQTATFGGLTFRSTDIIEWDPSTNTASMYFDGLANGLGGSFGDRGIDAFFVTPTQNSSLTVPLPSVAWGATPLALAVIIARTALVRRSPNAHAL